MRTLRHRDESDSESNSELDDRHVEEDSGWNEPIELDLYVKNKDHDGKIKAQIIRKANALVPLSSIIFKHKIEFTRTNTPSGWSHKCRCPFPTHNDGSPSFGYNSKDDRFWCFGCKRSGGSVQFLSGLQYDRNQYEIAKELLASTTSTEAVIVDLEEKNTSRIDDMLLEFSKSIHSFLLKHQDDFKAIECVEKVTWSLDMYLDRHAMAGSIDPDSLAARLEKLTERLGEYGG